jgi:hypothetical protein
MVTDGKGSVVSVTAEGDANLQIYLQLIADHDREEFMITHAGEAIPASRVLIFFDDDPAVHENGFYMPDDGEAPRVYIHRPGFQDPGVYRAIDVARESPAPLRELLWLAHELGHHAVVLRCLGTGLRNDECPAESYAEEVLAWGFARRILQGTTFDDWDEFQRVAESSLRTYEQGFKLDAAVVEDIRKRVQAQLTKAG